MATVSEELHALIDRLSMEEQRQVFEYAQRLSQLRQLLLSLPRSSLPRGKPANALLSLGLPSENAEEMERAVQDCERVDVDEY
jgi:hypothetical protein